MEKKQNDASFVFLLTDAQTKMAVVGLQKTRTWSWMNTPPLRKRTENHTRSAHLKNMEKHGKRRATASIVRCVTLTNAGRFTRPDLQPLCDCSCRGHAAFVLSPATVFTISSFSFSLSLSSSTLHSPLEHSFLKSKQLDLRFLQAVNYSHAR